MRSPRLSARLRALASAQGIWRRYSSTGASDLLALAVAAFFVLWSLVPSDGEGERSELLILAACCSVVALAARFTGKRYPRQTCIAVDLALSTCAAIGLSFYHDVPSFGVMILFAVNIHSAGLRTRREAALILGYGLGAFFVAILASKPEAAAIMRWVAAAGTISTITWLLISSRERVRSRVADISLREQQQRAVAELSGLALLEPKLGHVMDRAVEVVAETLVLEHVAVLERRLDDTMLEQWASFGTKPSNVHPEYPLKEGTYCEYALGLTTATVSEDLRREDRFDTSVETELFGLSSVVKAPIPGRNGAFGVISAGSATPRRFGETDVSFLQSIANVLGAAVQRKVDERALDLTRRDASTLSGRLSTLIDASPVAIVEIDTEQRVTLWNRAAEEIFGWKRDEVIGRPPPTLPEGREQEPAEIIRRFRDGEKVVSLDTQRLRKDGSLFDYSIYVAPLLDEKGELKGAVSMGIDTTSELEARRELSRSRELHRTVIENSHDMIALLDPVGRFVFASPSYEQALGYSPDELLGVSPVSFVHPEDVQRASEALRAVSNGEGTSTIEVRMRHKRGSWVFVEGTTSSVMDSDGKLSSILVTVRDISERRIAEEELREAEARYRLLVEQLPLVTYIVTPGEKGRWVYLSPQLNEILGYRPQEWLGEPELFLESVHPEDRERVIADRASSSSRGRLASEYRIAARDGREVWVRDEAVVVRDQAGNPLYVQGYLLDITIAQEADVERRRLENQLLQSQKMEAIGRLAGGIAHDFNNLLTAITGYSELIVTDLDPDTPVARDAEEIKRAAEQAAAMTQQLLAFSRRQVLQPQLMSLNEVVMQMEKMLSRLIGEEIQLSIALSGELDPVRTDRAQIEQVLMNLVVNGRDAMPTGGGEITIETKGTLVDEPRAAELGIPPGPYVCLIVSDTGEGMDETTIEHVFEPFFTTKEQGKGTGLGLSTVHGIVEQSGGAIAVESSPGKGSSFSVFLPIAESTQSTEVVTRREQSARGNGSETLLLVEDEEMVRQLVGRVLRDAGYQVFEASSGQEAIELSESLDKPIDLLLTDVVMPGMSGRVLAEELTKRRPDLRVLFMSGYTEEAIIHHGIAGDTAFIGKPFTPYELSEKIRAILDGESDGAADGSPQPGARQAAV